MSTDVARAAELELMSGMEAINKATESGLSDVQRCFKDGVVFITGGTGFLGQQLIEKLFRSCPGIRKLYILMRSKKGKSIQRRLEYLLKDPVFDAVKKSNPDFINRIIPVEGDITELRLGLSHKNWETISHEVTLIYHLAATVRFNEPLKTAIIANVRGTREVIYLAKASSKLCAMVYVSTAYSQCQLDRVKETYYASPVPPTAMIEFVENVTESKIDGITKELIKGWPNTYSFSKAIAEEVIRTMGDGLPVCVVRPAIVTASYSEPTPGWLERGNVFALSGLILGGCLGVMQVVYKDISVNADIVPVDYVSNLIIVASWETAKSGRNNMVYTLSRFRNKYQYGDMWKLWNEEVHKYQSPRVVLHATQIATSNPYIYFMLSLLLHFIPGLIIDGVLMIMRNKLRILKYYVKAYQLNKLLSYFSCKSWELHDENTLALHQSLSKTDQQIFNFDIQNVDIKSYTVGWWLGIRKYLIKDGLIDTEYACKKQKVLKIISIILIILYVLFICYICSSLYRFLYFICFMGILYLFTQHAGV